MTGRVKLAVAFLAGMVAMFLMVSWRIGAADAYAKLYAVGAMEAGQQLLECQKGASPWPRKRGLAP